MTKDNSPARQVDFLHQVNRLEIRYRAADLQDDITAGLLRIWSLANDWPHLAELARQTLEAWIRRVER